MVNHSVVESKEEVEQALADVSSHHDLTKKNLTENKKAINVRLEELYAFIASNRYRAEGMIADEVLESENVELSTLLKETVDNLIQVKESVKEKTDLEKEKSAKQIHDQLRIFNNLGKQYCETKSVLESSSKSKEEKVESLNKYGKEVQEYEKKTHENFPATSSLGKKVALALLIGSGLLLGAVLGAAVGLAVGSSTGLIGHIPGVVAGGAVGAVIGSIKGAGIGVEVALGAAAFIFGAVAVAGIKEAYKEHPDKKYQKNFLDRVPRLSDTEAGVAARAEVISQNLKKGGFMGEGEELMDRAKNRGPKGNKN